MAMTSLHDAFICGATSAPLHAMDVWATCKGALFDRLQAISNSDDTVLLTAPIGLGFVDDKFVDNRVRFVKWTGFSSLNPRVLTRAAWSLLSYQLPTKHECEIILSVWPDLLNA
jgi:hypothetical protein